MELSERTLRNKDGEKHGWRLLYLEAAAREGRKILDDIQYAYVLEAFDEIALARDPKSPETHDVVPIYDFFEFRDKGGHLGKINLRVYFSVHEEVRSIVVLSTYKKEDEGKTPARIVRRAKNRLRQVKQLLQGERLAVARKFRGETHDNRPAT